MDAEQCRVTLTTDSLNWAIMALGVAGADFRVLEPPELRARLHDWGTRFIRACSR